MGRLNDLTGRVFGRLTVISRADNNKTGQAYWNCKCECRQEKSIRGSHLISGVSASCGCYNTETITKHRMCGTPEYRTYYNIRKRCYSTEDKRYADYGGRGICMCDAWLESFENFYSDMGRRPSSKHSIDRIDNDGHYEPSNCRWADRITQVRNSRTPKNSPTGEKGVVKSVIGNFVAQIYVLGKTKRLGTYKSLEEATEARKAGELKYWGVMSNHV